MMVMGPGDRFNGGGHKLLHRHEAIDVGQPGVQGIMGAKGGREGKFLIKATEKQ